MSASRSRRRSRIVAIQVGVDALGVGVGQPPPGEHVAVPTDDGGVGELPPEHGHVPPDLLCAPGRRRRPSTSSPPAGPVGRPGSPPAPRRRERAVIRSASWPLPNCGSPRIRGSCPGTYWSHRRVARAAPPAPGAARITCLHGPGRVASGHGPGASPTAGTHLSRRSRQRAPRLPRHAALTPHRSRRRHGRDRDDPRSGDAPRRRGRPRRRAAQGPRRRRVLRGQFEGLGRARRHREFPRALPAARARGPAARRGPDRQPRPATRRGRSGRLGRAGWEETLGGGTFVPGGVPLRDVPGYEDEDPPAG